MDWATNLKSFIRVVDEGSFTAAARQMNTTTSALSKRVSWLEQQLKTQLLMRTTRSISLTEAGSLLYQRGGFLVHEWQSLIDETRALNRDPVGVLKIGAPPVIGSRFLIPIVEKFLDCYPKLQIQISTNYSGQNPRTDQDLMISTHLGPQFNSSSYKMYRLLEFRRQFFASPKYLARYGSIDTPEQLEQANTLIWGEQNQMNINCSNGRELHLKGRIATQNAQAMLQAARQGLGILLGAGRMLEEELHHQELVPILPELETETETLYAFYPNLGYEQNKTRLFLDFLREHFTEHPITKN